MTEDKERFFHVNPNCKDATLCDPHLDSGPVTYGGRTAQRCPVDEGDCVKCGRSGLVFFIEYQSGGIVWGRLSCPECGAEEYVNVPVDELKGE